METRSLDRMLAILATLAALTVAAMVVGIIFTRGSQDFFQTARALEAYSTYLATPWSRLACGSISGWIICS